MLHHHCKGFVDIELVIHKVRSRRLTVIRILDPFPIHQNQGIMGQSRVTLGNGNQTAAAFAEPNGSVLFIHTDHVARLGSVQFFFSEIAALAFRIPIRYDARRFFLRRAGSDRLCAKLCDQLPSGQKNIRLRLHLGRVDVPEKHLGTVHQRGYKITLEALCRSFFRIPVNVENHISRHRCIQETASQKIVQLIPIKSVIGVTGQKPARFLDADAFILIVKDLHPLSGEMHRHLLAHNGGNEIVDHSFEKIKNRSWKVSLFHTVPLISSVKPFIAIHRVVQSNASVISPALFQKSEILCKKFLLCLVHIASLFVSLTG